MDAGFYWPLADVLAAQKPCYKIRRKQNFCDGPWNCGTLRFGDQESPTYRPTLPHHELFGEHLLLTFLCFTNFRSSALSHSLV